MKSSKTATGTDPFGEISSWVSSAHDLDHHLDLILTTIRQMMRARVVSLLLVDRDAGRLYLRTVTGSLKTDTMKREIPLSRGIAGYVADAGEPVVVPDVHRDPRWDGEPREFTGFEIFSLACAPLKIREEIIGVVEVIDREDGQPFQDEDLKLLNVYADAAALAVDKAEKNSGPEIDDRGFRDELCRKCQIIGESDALRKVVEQAFKVARSNASTLLLGESGTGKELLARLIHQASARRDNPMIGLNCAALPETLMEDELFGHEKGAYTGALKRKIGKFELADKGTLFLDEIGEMSAAMQAKMLRVLQEGAFYRVGGNLSVTVDVRVISATNRDIQKEVNEGRFREDLYYRMNVVQIKMPPLRQRREDIPLLAEYFLAFFRKERGLSNLRISDRCMDNMMKYDWPGNIRELRNALERAVVMGDNEEIGPEDLPIFSPRTVYKGLEVGLTLNEAVNRFKREFIIANLRHTGGNRTKAAKKMDIQRTYLSRLISKLGIQDE
ncbi:MAG: Fis family transcriptional regulator [Deltaproteobacteria bacterium]|nr:MAG: Fis family transcriptional regulator [Deltaproteobacteria bacterium]